MEVAAPRPPSFLLAAVLVFFLLASAPCPMEARLPQGILALSLVLILGSINYNR
jgi:hypothetical protein